MPEHGGYALQGADAFAATVIELAGRAERDIALLSQRLPSQIYGNSAFLQQIKHMIRDNAGRRTQLRVLVQEPRAINIGNRLITLGQELPDFLAFKQPAAEDADLCGEWLIIDQQHFLERQTSARVDATCHINTPLKARAARRRFEQAWALATAIPELRRLSL